MSFPSFARSLRSARISAVSFFTCWLFLPYLFTSSLRSTTSLARSFLSLRISRRSERMSRLSFAMSRLSLRMSRRSLRTSFLSLRISLVSCLTSSLEGFEPVVEPEPVWLWAQAPTESRPARANPVKPRRTILSKSIFPPLEFRSLARSQLAYMDRNPGRGKKLWAVSAKIHFIGSTLVLRAAGHRRSPFVHGRRLASATGWQHCCRFGGIAEIKSCYERNSEAQPNSKLSGERHTHSGARAEEIAQSPGGHANVVWAVDWPCLRAAWIQAEGRRVGTIVHRRGQASDVSDKVVARVHAVEQIEELHKRPQGEPLAETELSAHAEVHLIERYAAELVERGRHAVDHRSVVGVKAVAVQIHVRAQGEWPRAFKLR